MTRQLYTGIVRLHPREFRDEFGGEMLWIFEEASGGPIIGTATMIRDALSSLVRQWVIGQAVWKFPAALLGGMLYFLLACSLLVPRHLPPFEAPVDFGLSPIAWPDQPGR